MIGYLEGNIIHSGTDSILLLAGSIGYEILLNPQLAGELRSLPADDNSVSLYIYYHQTERQPKPVLIGFRTLEDKEFFQTFITVDAIGPMKAVKAMNQPAGKIAMAIEKKDVTFLTTLTGIGKRTAEKIVATLNGKVEKFIAGADKIPSDTIAAVSDEIKDISRQVEDVLVEQLGHSAASARRMVKEAFEKNKSISTPEELFDQVFKE